MTKKLYRLLKDSPELKAGAILEEECEDGDQGFDCINMEDYSISDTQDECKYNRKVVMNQPEWFEEVKKGFFPIKLPKGLNTQLKKIVTFDE